MKINVHFKKPAYTLIALPLLIMALSAQANNVSGDAKRGERIFTGAETIEGVAACNTCHGKDGNETLGPTFPKLAGQHADYIVQALGDYKQSIRNNAVMMPIASKLTSKDMHDVAVYLDHLPGKITEIPKD